MGEDGGRERVHVLVELQDCTVLIAAEAIIYFYFHICVNLPSD